MKLLMLKSTPLKSKLLTNLLLTLLLLFSSSCELGGPPRSQANSKQSARSLEGVGVDEKLGSKVDIQNLEFTDENGKKVKLSDYFAVKQPVILILGYYECPKLCSLVFNGFSVSARSLEWSIGEEYKVLTVSVNPEEGPELALAKKNNYVNNYGRRSAKDGWHFLTGDEKNVKALADQVGFRYKYDPKIEQYAHAALLTFLTPEGKISRYLYGIDFKHNDLKLALLEAAQGTIGTVMEQLLLFCFHYNPDADSYSFTVFLMMQAAGALTLLLLGGFLLKFWVGQWRRKP